MLAIASPAGAATLCAGIDRPECLTAPRAFAEAQDGDRIELGRIRETAPLASDRRIDVFGLGEGRTVLEGGLRLTSPRAGVADLTAQGLELGGTGTRLRVLSRATLRGTAVLQASSVDGSLETAGADTDARLQSVVVRVQDDDGVRACTGALTARHITVLGSGPSGARSCGGQLRLRNSIIAGAFTRPLDGPVDSASSAQLPGPDPLQVDADGRLPAGSPLIDAGSPEPLSASEWPEDRDGLPRVADGDGDGTVARDLGAFERPRPPVRLPPGNLVRDAGAEDPGGWTLGGGFEIERYGAWPFPSAAAGAALGAGHAFFAGGPNGASTASQMVDVTRFAPEIDSGQAVASLSALLGGFRADADVGILEARFLGPGGDSLGDADLATPEPEDRGNATTLLPRLRRDAVPRLTRAIEVRMRAVRTTASYSDAYFDNVALTLSPPPAPVAPRARPFAGVRVIDPIVTLGRRGRLRVRVACPQTTVGRCTGVLTATTLQRRRGRVRRLGSVPFSWHPGVHRIRVRLTPRAARRIRRRHRTPMTVFAAARDGQGVTRVSTVPVRAKRKNPPRPAPPEATQQAAPRTERVPDSRGTRGERARPPVGRPAADVRRRS
jgi:hypothetical protein